MFKLPLPPSPCTLAALTLAATLAALPGGYTFVTFVSDTQIDIGFTDFDPTRADPFQNMSVTLLLTPVPEPGSFALLLAGLAAVGRVVRRRRA